LRVTIFLRAALGLLAAAAATAADFYVAVDGNDSAAGTAQAPFSTLDRARGAVRELRQRTPGRAEPITVTIRGGTYYLDAPLVFGAEDSGTAAAPLIYAAAPGERPVFSAGRAIGGWVVTRPGV
jgi:hypothetical protein